MKSICIITSLVLFATGLVNAKEETSSKNNQIVVLKGKGRYVFGKLSSSDSPYLLDTETGRLWKQYTEKNIDTLVPVIYKTLNNDIKLQPGGVERVAEQEVKLQLKRREVVAEEKRKLQKQAIAKQAIMSYLKFISKTETLHREISKLLKTKKITETQRKVLQKSLKSQQINIEKIQVDLKKLLSVNNPELTNNLNPQVLQNINTKLSGLAQKCNELCATVNTSNKTEKTVSQ